MAVGLKLAGANAAYKGGLLNAARYIGLFSAEGTELSGNGYARVEMALTDWQADGAVYENAAQEVFGPPSAVWSPITHWGLFDALTAGNMLFDVDAPDTSAPALNALVASAAEALGWSFTALTTAGSLKALNEGLLSGTRYISLHTGSSATVGNTINTDGTTGGSGTALMVQISDTQWSLDTQNSGLNRRARNNVVRGFGVQAADLPDPQSYALRDGNARNSAILASAALTSENPDVGDALDFAVNSMAIHCTITATI